MPKRKTAERKEVPLCIPGPKVGLGTRIALLQQVLRSTPTAQHMSIDCAADCVPATFVGPVCATCLCCRACAGAYAYTYARRCPECKS